MLVSSRDHFFNNNIKQERFINMAINRFAKLKIT